MVETEAAPAKEEKKTETTEEVPAEAAGESETPAPAKEDAKSKSETKADAESAPVRAEEKAEEKKEEAPAKKEGESETPASSSPPDETVLAGVENRLKFFLSDANIRQDRFVRDALLPRDPNAPVGFISVESLLKFNTIKQYTTDPKVIVDVVKTRLSDRLKLNESETSVGRITPFTKDLMDENIPVSLYVKGVPIKDPEGDQPTYSVDRDEVLDIFKPFGTVALVKLKFSPYKNGSEPTKRNHRSRQRFPVGHATVEFESAEDMKKAADATLTYKEGAEIEPKTPLTLGDSKLTVMLLSEYIEEKKKEGKEARSSGKKHGRDEKEVEKEDPNFKPFTFDWKPGCVIRIEGLPEECSRESILVMLAESFKSSVDDIKDKKIYVDYSRGQKDGAIRFPEVVDEIAKIAKDLESGDLKIADTKVTKAELLTGDEEKEYWTKFIDFKNNQIKQKNNNSRSPKKFRRGGRR